MTLQRSFMLFREGTIKGEHTQTLGLSSGSSDTECSGPINKSQTLYSGFLSAFIEQSITRMNCVLYLSICMYPDLSGELLVSVTLEAGIEQSTDHNPLAVDCEGRINC